MKIDKTAWFRNLYTSENVRFLVINALPVFLNNANKVLSKSMHVFKVDVRAVCQFLRLIILAVQ